MFSFLFKRSAKPSTPATENPKNREQDEASGLAAEKAAALAEAHRLAGNESAAAEFVLHCKFSDARLQAANHVHSRQLLERLAQAMRETDRRVSRLAQQRLEAIKQKKAVEREAAFCIERIQSLANEPVVLPNQLSEIERSWNALHAVPEELAHDFSQGRAIVQQRLHEQTTLQLSLIELRNAVQAVSNELEILPPSSPADALSAQLDMLAERFASSSASTEVQSLPKNLVSDVETMFAHARRSLDRLAQRRAAIAAYEQVYAVWEANSDAIPDINLLRRELRSLPALAAADEQMFEQRFERLQARSAPTIRPQQSESAKPDMSKYRHGLDALERALDEGALLTATEHEKELRADDHIALTWNAEEIARLARARAELNRLKSWARWGGKVSREELIKTAEELPLRESSPTELAKKLGSLRSQWKSMDAASGAADKEAWQRFDAACTAAYAPVAVHFSALAAERKANIEKARALLSQIRDFAAAELATDEQTARDWKKIAVFRSRMLQAWREVGAVDRKEKKALDRQFSDAMDVLSAPLAAQQQEEMKRREELVDQVKRIDSSGRNASALLRQIQQQWQQHAKSMPLARKDEQALWLRFRAACDEHVARRDAGRQQLNARYAKNYRLKIALCDRLESETDDSPEDLERLLNEAEQQWESIGPVARASEPSLHERYRGIVSGMRSKLAREQQAVRRKQLDQLFKKLGLCIAVEQMLASGMQTDVSALEQEWGMCDALSEEFEHVLGTRFRAARSALQSGDAHYASILRQNRAALERDMLCMEIKLEIESSPELSAARLQLQVEALQASMKSGSRSSDKDCSLLKLCELPALHDHASLARIERMIHRLGTIQT